MGKFGAVVFWVGLAIGLAFSSLSLLKIYNNALEACQEHNPTANCEWLVQ